jgi:hypothetical protein
MHGRVVRPARARYLTLETMTTLSDDPLVSLPALTIPAGDRGGTRNPHHVMGHDLWWCHVERCEQRFMERGATDERYS